MANEMIMPLITFLIVPRIFCTIPATTIWKRAASVWGAWVFFILSAGRSMPVPEAGLKGGAGGDTASKQAPQLEQNRWSRLLGDPH